MGCKTVTDNEGQIQFEANTINTGEYTLIAPPISRKEWDVDKKSYDCKFIDGGILFTNGSFHQLKNISK